MKNEKDNDFQKEEAKSALDIKVIDQQDEE